MKRMNLALAFCLGAAGLGGVAQAQSQPQPAPADPDAAQIAQEAAKVTEALCHNYYLYYNRTCTDGQRAELTEVLTASISVKTPSDDEEFAGKILRILGLTKEEFLNPPDTPEVRARIKEGEIRDMAKAFCQEFREARGVDCSDAQRAALVKILREEWGRPEPATAEENEKRLQEFLDKVGAVLGLPLSDDAKAAPPGAASARAAAVAVRRATRFTA